MIIDDVNNLGGFAFEKFVNSKIIAEGLKKRHDIKYRARNAHNSMD